MSERITLCLSLFISICVGRRYCLLITMSICENLLEVKYTIFKMVPLDNDSSLQERQFINKMNIFRCIKKNFDDEDRCWLNVTEHNLSSTTKIK